MRSLRAAPPGRASSGRRGKTFGAALEQFEQLLLAAKNVPPHSAPILLFYALAQGGRAILAARAPDQWEIHGHGLSATPQRDPIGATCVAPSGNGLFQAVAAATGSASVDRAVTLSEIWGRIPGLRRGPKLGLEEPPLFMVSEEPRGGRRRVIRDQDGSLLRDPTQFMAMTSRWPEIGMADVAVQDQGELSVVSLEFGEQSSATAFDALLWEYLGAPYLRSSAGTAREPAGLMMWWLLLLALAQLARYEPAGWTHALTPDRSAVTVPIEDTLRRAERLLPRLVLDALVV